MSILDFLAKKTDPSQPSIPRISRVAASSDATEVAVGTRARGDDIRRSEKSSVNAFSEPSVSDVSIQYGNTVFQVEKIDSVEILKNIVFSSVINRKLELGSHLNNRIAVAKLTEAGTDVILFVDRTKSSVQEVDEVVALIVNKDYRVISGYFADAQLILTLAQGHLNAEDLKAARDIARDPTKNSLFEFFLEIVGWAFDNNADDIDFVVDNSSETSRVCFKIGGSYLRPDRWKINTETLNNVIAIAWQSSAGGSSAQFDPLIEQQAKINIELPKVPGTRPHGARLRLRWSGLANDKGPVITTRIQRLGQSATVKSLESGGYLTSGMNTFHRSIGSGGGLVCFAGTVGSGKSTSLAQLLSLVPNDYKIQSIEDPVELDIPNAHQKTVARQLISNGAEPGFLSAAQALFRSALDIMYLGEVRDTETGGLARQILQSGHGVFTTTHAASALGIIPRFESPQIGVPRDVLGTTDIIKLLVYQVLLKVNCPHCALAPTEHQKKHRLQGKDLNQDQVYWDRLESMYGLDTSSFRVRQEQGCEHCRKSDLPELNGYQGRTVVYEMFEPDDIASSHILSGRSDKLHQYWRSQSNGKYDSPDLTGKSAMECAIYKAAEGKIEPYEIERRFPKFETIYMKSKANNASLKAA